MASKMADRTGVFKAITGTRVRCQRPIKCEKDAVAYSHQDGLWLCQDCHDAVQSVRWSVGQESGEPHQDGLYDLAFAV